jgi:uncharacterized RDD family membrane protein YckC
VRLVLIRLLAFALDWVVLFAALAAPQALVALVWGDWPLASVDSGWLVWGWVLLTVSLPSWVYFTISDSSRRGATVGKRVLGLAVRDDADDGRLSRGRSLARTAVKLLPWELTHVMIFLPEPIGETLTPFKTGMIVLVNSLMLIWLVVPVIRPDRRALHDLAAGSVVTRTRD